MIIHQHKHILSDKLRLKCINIKFKFNWKHRVLGLLSRTGRNANGLSRAHRCHLDLNWTKLNWTQPVKLTCIYIVEYTKASFYSYPVNKATQSRGHTKFKNQMSRAQYVNVTSEGVLKCCWHLLPLILAWCCSQISDYVPV